MDLEQIFNRVRDLAYQGKESHEIDKELTHLHFSKEERIELNKHMDECIVQYQLAANEKSKVFNFMLMGIVIFVFSTGITLFTLLTNKSSFFLWLGGILGGGYMIWANYIEYKKPLDFNQKQRNRIMKKRQGKW